MSDIFMHTHLMVVIAGHPLQTSPRISNCSGF